MVGAYKQQRCVPPVNDNLVLVTGHGPWQKQGGNSSAMHNDLISHARQIWRVSRSTAMSMQIQGMDVHEPKTALGDSRHQNYFEG